VVCHNQMRLALLGMSCSAPGLPALLLNLIQVDSCVLGFVSAFVVGLGTFQLAPLSKPCRGSRYLTISPSFKAYNHPYLKARG